MADGKPSAQTDGTKRKALDISTKRVILNELAQGAKNCELVKKHGVSKSTISTILKNEDKIISADANSMDRKRPRRATYADVEEALLKWFVDAQARNIPISGPMMLAKAKDFAFLFDFPDFCPGNGWLHRFKVCHGTVFKSIVGEAASASDQDVASRRVVERMFIAVDRPAAKLPLRVSLYSALEMVKASPALPTSDPMPTLKLPKRTTPAVIYGSVLSTSTWECWDDFVTADDDADTAEPCTNEGTVNEVRGKSDSEESDDDDDETLEPAPTSVPVAIGYIDSLRQLVYAKGLGEEHAAALNKLETTLIAAELSKQTCITDFFAKK
ncbi:hypothetical protein HPB50_007139 [Hyalomma asiaticum]|uniref:Uncharacterized protein n=1 Tax=Hyalomma asiaticum TaxID=266040 RepID=A0ACB7TGB8_HYAAI|nr:hypothetical protein HPB50_007139 [Hyalomma asiaticum]